MQREIYFQTPYKQLKLNEISFDRDLKVLENRPLSNRKQRIPSHSQQEQLVGIPLKLDGLLNRTQYKKSQSRGKVASTHRFPKLNVRSSHYVLDEENLTKLKSGVKVDFSFLNDMMQSKYEQSNKQAKFFQKGMRGRVMSERQEVVEIKNINKQNLRRQLHTVQSQEQKRMQQEKSKDIIVYFGSSSIHVPAMIGDPIFYEQQKLESFRAQYRLRDKFSRDKFSKRSMTLNQSLGGIRPEKVGSTEVKIFIKDGGVRVENQSYSILKDPSSILQSVGKSSPVGCKTSPVNRSGGKSSPVGCKTPPVGGKTSPVNRSGGKTSPVNKSLPVKRSEKQKKYKIEEQIQKQLIEKKQKEEEQDRLREQQEIERVAQNIYIRKEKIQLMKQLKTMIQNGETEAKIAAFRQVIENFNPLAADEKVEVVVNREELIRRQQEEERQRKFKLKEHYDLINRLNQKISDLITIPRTDNPVLENIKERQSKILGRAIYHKTISLDLQRQLQLDFKSILKTLNM